MTEIRISMGKIWTKEDWEKYRKKVLSKPLPGRKKNNNKKISVFLKRIFFN